EDVALGDRAVRSEVHAQDADRALGLRVQIGLRERALVREDEEAVAVAAQIDGVEQRVRRAVAAGTAVERRRTGSSGRLTALTGRGGVARPAVRGAVLI